MYDSAADIKRIVLTRADEATDGTSDFNDAYDDIFIEVWRDLTVRHPWLCLIKDPPGALLTVAPVSGLTLTVAAGGASVAGTLSSAVASSLVGRKIAPIGGTYVMRVTAHIALTANVTLDAVPEALTNANVLIYQDEYAIASDVGLFVDGLWTPERGDPIPLISEERLKIDYSPGAAVAAYPPRAFARLTNTKIRLAGYPTAVRRLEYPYAYEPTAPATSDTAALVIDQTLRATLATGCLALLYKLKLDRRLQLTAQSYEKRIQKYSEYETRKRTTVLGRTSGAPRASIYGE